MGELVAIEEAGPVPYGQVRQATTDDKVRAMFLVRYEKRSAHTFKAYLTDLAAFDAFTGVRALHSLTVEDFQSFQTDLVARGLSPATQARRMSTVRSLMAFACRIGYLRFNPAAVIDLPKVAITTGERFLTLDECQALVAALASNPRDHLLAVLLLKTGVRISEMAGIRWSSFYQDPSGNIGLRVTGKGSKVRGVKVTPDVWQLVLAYRQATGQFTVLSSGADDPLFNGRGQALTANAMWRIIKAGAAKAGIVKPVSPHWLRHTHATLAILGGATISQIKDALGHEDIRVSARYEHSVKQLQETAADHVRLKF